MKTEGVFDVLVLVKTSPLPSRKYGEVVCAAGVLPTGEWVRLFPVPFRRLGKSHQFKKYQWIKCYAYKPENDDRPESYHIDMMHDIEVGEYLRPVKHWEMRRQSVLDKVKPKIYTNLEELKRDGLGNKVTLAVFKPTRVRFHSVVAIKPDDPKRIHAAMSAVLSPDLFEDNSWREKFRLCEKTPFDFKYEVVDDAGKKANFTILDWEISTLFYKQKLTHNGDIEKARSDVEHMYSSRFLSKDIDLHLYMGTMNKFQHMHVNNPWSIIGVAPFPKVESHQMAFL